MLQGQYFSLETSVQYTPGMVINGDSVVNYQVRPILPARSKSNRFFGQHANPQGRVPYLTNRSVNSQKDSANHGGSNLKRFVVFTRCVVRSFYIYRFQANNIGPDPLPLGIDDDPLCPETPRYYLQAATRFSDRFFNL